MRQEEFDKLMKKSASIWESIFFYELKRTERNTLKTFSDLTERTLTYA